MSSRLIPDVYIAYDHSNVYVAGKHVAARRDGPSASSDFRIHFPSVLQLARAGRHVAGVYAAGTGPAPDHPMWERARQAGIPIEILERGCDTNTEQGVDATIQCKMVRALLDAERPGVLVLITGDGAGDERGEGFLADARRAQRLGFGIEVLAWAGCSCSRDLRDFVSNLGVHGAFVDLSRYYSQISYLEGRRQSLPLSLRGRPLAVPAPDLAVSA